MKIKGVLTILSSKRDKYGNVYYAVRLQTDWDKVAHGTICADNVSTLDCREVMNWYVDRVSLPIREFNSIVKAMPHIGCTWEEIKNNLLKQLKDQKA